MNHAELETQLKTVPVPERSEAYWEEFPAHIRRHLEHSRTQPASRETWQMRYAWLGGCAVTLALVFTCVQFDPIKALAQVMVKQQRHFQVRLARLDAGLHTLMLNTHGMGYLLAESN